MVCIGYPQILNGIDELKHPASSQSPVMVRTAVPLPNSRMSPPLVSLPRYNGHPTVSLTVDESFRKASR